MAEYTSTKAGFQRAMDWSLSGPISDAKSYVEATSTPSFYHILNGEKIECNKYLKAIEDWRGRCSQSKPNVEQFLRDGDQLAVRMTGTVKMDGQDTAFESFMFAKIEEESGKMEWLIERIVSVPVSKELDYGAR